MLCNCAFVFIYHILTISLHFIYLYNCWRRDPGGGRDQCRAGSGPVYALQHALHAPYAQGPAVPQAAVVSAALPGLGSRVLVPVCAPTRLVHPCDYIHLHMHTYMLPY